MSKVYWVADSCSIDHVRIMKVDEIKDLLVGIWENDIFIEAEDVEGTPKGECPVSNHINKIKRSNDIDFIDEALLGVGYISFDSFRDYRDYREEADFH